MLMMNFMNISKGVNKNQDKIDQKPAPIFKQKPFRNFQNEAMISKNFPIGSYGPHGNFIASSLSDAARKHSMNQMKLNTGIVNLVNGKRRGDF